MSFFKELFGSETSRKLKGFAPIVEKINSLENGISSLTDEELKAKTAQFKERLSSGEALGDILPESFAVVREAAKRTLGQRHYDVQLVGGLTLHGGDIAEMKTGEGKTLVATLPVYLNALTGKGVHVVTVNDYLSRRDAVWMGQIYAFLGLSVGVINGQDQSFLYDPGHTDQDEERDELGGFKVVYEFLRPASKKEAYSADITYGTNSEFGFDYLRDNTAYARDQLAQRPDDEGGFHYAIIDEIDSILIDEARTPLIISAPAQKSEDLYNTFAKIAAQLKEGEHYEVEEKHSSAALTDAGIEKAEDLLGIQNIYTEAGIKHVHHLETAVRAKANFLRDRDYVVRDGQVVIVDQFTGRLQPGRRWSEGLHQAIEAKEGVAIQQESRTFASITYQNYFRQYSKLAGMTGTAETSSEEFYKVYGLETVVIPTNKPIARVDRDDFIFRTQEGKFKAIARKVAELNKKGQPVLIGTVAVEDNERLAAFLQKEGVSHEILNAKNHEREGEIIAQAGKKSAVTIATNMAGRGVDIKLGGVPAPGDAYEKIKSFGGLFVLGTERHEARRIDNQLRGRSGRQGDPGETQFFVSMDDKLMRVFAADTVRSLMERMNLPEDEPINHKMITRSLETAQKKIEGLNFDARKHVLEFDDVLNTQRTTIYGRRRRVLLGGPEEVMAVLSELVAEDENAQGVLEEKEKALGKEEFIKVVRRMMLQTMDLFWVDHLETMDHLRSSVGLRAYGQRDPLVEYKHEGLRLFRNLEANISERVRELLPNLGVGAFAAEQERLKKQRERIKAIGGDDTKTSNQAPAKSEKKYGRNDLVTITNGTETREIKFKKAERLLAEGWRIQS